MKLYTRINQIILSLVICSTSLLITVLYFQHVLNLLPCKLCLWQRAPHGIIIIIGLLILNFRSFRLVGSVVCTLTMISSSILAGYHVGIEYGFWSGPQSCSSITDLTTLSADLFLEAVLSAPIIRCDDVSWSFLRISMAGWNFIFSSLLTGFWSLVAFQIFKVSNHQLWSSASQ